MFLSPLRRSPSARRSGRLVAVLVIILCLSIFGTYGGYAYYQSRQDVVVASALITKTAVKAPFDHIVLEQGEIESSSNIELTCGVRSRDGTSILWVIDEGTRVKKGDKLVELDTSDLELRLKDQKIQVITAKADVTTAEAVLEQAKISKEEYLEGLYITQLKEIDSRVAVAKQNLSKAKLAKESSERLAARGYVKSLQLQADDFAVQNAQNAMDSAKAELRVLEKFTKRKMLVQFESDIESADAKLQAAKSELMEETNDLNEIEEQLESCIMYAPTDGVVVHANRYSSRGGNAEFVVEAGANVRERQAIIRLPDPTQMQVKCKVNESRITLIEEGMPCRIRVDAIPDLKLTGRVRKVNRYAEPGSWYSSSIKEYATTVEIVDPPEEIRTGMTAEVQIFVEQLDDALQIPIEGLYEHDGTMYSLVRRGPTSFETKAIEMAATNDTMAAIADGLSPDDEIVLNLRQHLSLLDLPEIRSDDNSDMKRLAGLRGEAIAIAQTGRGKPSGSRQAGADGNESFANGRPGAGGPGAGGPGDRRPGGGGGPPRGGGPPSPAVIVKQTMDNYDRDNDGRLSSDEVASMDDRFRSRVSGADTDGDGFVTRAEMIAMIRKGFGGNRG